MEYRSSYLGFDVAVLVSGHKLVKYIDRGRRTGPRGTILPRLTPMLTSDSMLYCVDLSNFRLHFDVSGASSITDQRAMRDFLSGRRKCSHVVYMNGFTCIPPRSRCSHQR